jgi:hypothetical protein
MPNLIPGGGLMLRCDDDVVEILEALGRLALSMLPSSINGRMLFYKRALG